MTTIKITEKVASAEKMEEVLEQIIRLIKAGYTCGHYPSWVLTETEL